MIYAEKPELDNTLDPNTQILPGYSASKGDHASPGKTGL
jgi:hypothetical protein